MHRYNASSSTSTDKRTDNENLCTCCPIDSNNGMYYDARLIKCF